MRRALAIGLALASLMPARPAAADLKGTLTGSLAPGIDTNPRRTVGEESPTDGFLSLTGTAKGKLTLGERQALAGRYDLGLKKFWDQTSEDLAVQQADLDYVLQAGAFLVGASGSGKLRLSRQGSRDYLDLTGDAYADWALDRQLSLRLALGVRRFWYPPDAAYGSLGPQANLLARYAFNRQHAFTAGLTGALPRHEGFARQSDGTYSGDRRSDRQLGAIATWAFRGKVAAQAGYAFFHASSNSFGESSWRHRLSGAVSARLPPGFFGVLQAGYQFIRYPDGIFLSQNLLLLDDESQSSVAAKLAWPLTPAVDLEARYAVYWIALPPRAESLDAVPASYLRQLATAGLTARW